MKKKDIEIFIKEMKAIGDDWTPKQVAEVYGDSTLEDALADRKSLVGTFFNIISKVINRE